MLHTKLKEIKKRWDNATKGPWRTERASKFVRQYKLESRDSTDIVYAESLAVCSPERLEPYGIIPHGIVHKDDAVAIASAPEDVAALLRAVGAVYEWMGAHERTKGFEPLARDLRKRLNAALEEKP